MKDGNGRRVAVKERCFYNLHPRTTPFICNIYDFSDLVCFHILSFSSDIKMNNSKVMVFGGGAPILLACHEEARDKMF